mgnify:CR=1 FL=1
MKTDGENERLRVAGEMAAELAKRKDARFLAETLHVHAWLEKHPANVPFLDASNLVRGAAASLAELLDSEDRPVEIRNAAEQLYRLASALGDKAFEGLP